MESFQSPALPTTWASTPDRWRLKMNLLLASIGVSPRSHERRCQVPSTPSLSLPERKFSPVSFLIIYLGPPPDPDTPPSLSHLGERISPKTLGAPSRCKAGTGAGLGGGAPADWQTAWGASPSPNLAGAAGQAGGDIKGTRGRGEGRGAGAHPPKTGRPARLGFSQKRKFLG